MKNKTQPNKQSEHTPTPWKLDYPEIIGSNGEKVIDYVPYEGQDINEINSEFVVHAVNSHEALLEFAKKVEKYAFKASGDELLMWAQSAIEQAEGGK